MFWPPNIYCTGVRSGGKHNDIIIGLWLQNKKEIRITQNKAIKQTEYKTKTTKHSLTALFHKIIPSLRLIKVKLAHTLIA